MKAVLVVPISTALHDPFAYPPMGPMMIAAVLREDGHDPHILFAHHVPDEGVTYGTSRNVSAYTSAPSLFNSADIIGVNIFSEATFDAARAVLEDALYTDAWLIAGGAFATSAPEETLDAGFDIAVRDEGEETIMQVIDVLKQEPSYLGMTSEVADRLKVVQGISFQDENGRRTITHPRSNPRDLDLLPRPAWDLIDPSIAAQETHTHLAPGRISTTVFATRGCPFDCTFCLTPDARVYTTHHGYRGITALRRLTGVMTHKGDSGRYDQRFERQYEGTVYELQYPTGKVTATPEHPVAVVDMQWHALKGKQALPVKWTRADQLTEGQYVWCFDDEQKMFIPYPIRSISQKQYAGPVYNIEVLGDNSFIANGLVVHNCNREIGGRFFRSHSVDYILDHLRHLRDRYGVTHVRFPDDLFTTNHRWVREISAALGDDNFTWVALSRTDTLSDDLAADMHAGGCRGLFFGIESGSQRILDLMRKGTTPADNGRAIEICREAGITSSAYFIFGFPGENRESVEDTVSWLDTYRPDRAHYSTFLPIHGTDPHRHPDQFGIRIKPGYRNWYYYDDPEFPVEYLPPNPSNAELAVLRDYLHRAFDEWGYLSFAERASVKEAG